MGSKVHIILDQFLSVIQSEHDTSITSMIKGNWNFGAKLELIVLTPSFHHCVDPTMTPPSHTQLLTSCGVWPVNQDLTLVHLLILDFHISFAVDTDKWHLITVMSRVHRQNKQKQKITKRSYCYVRAVLHSCDVFTLCLGKGKNFNSVRFRFICFIGKKHW